MAQAQWHKLRLCSVKVSSAAADRHKNVTDNSRQQTCWLNASLVWLFCSSKWKQQKRRSHGVWARLWTGVTDCCCHSSQSSSEVATTTSVTSPWSLQHIFPSVSLRRQPSDYNSVSVYIIVIALAFCKTLVLYRYNVVNRELYCLMHLGDLASKKSKFARNYVHNSVIFKDKCLQHHQNVGMFSNHFSVVEPIRAVSISL